MASQWTPEMIVQSVIAIAVVVTICVMAGLGREVPKELWALGGLVLGWFGRSTAQAIVTRALSVRSK